MKKHLLIAAVAALLSVGSSDTASADVLTLAPAKVAVLPADQSGVTRVALEFDLSGLREGSGREINQAILGWEVPGISRETVAEFLVYEMDTAWDEEGVAAGLAQVSHREEEADVWDFHPRDYDRLGRGVIRLRLRDAVEGWANGRTANHGVLVVAGNIGREALSGALAGVRLHVWYGFAGEN